MKKDYDNIDVIKSKKRKLNVDFDCNNCTISLSEDFDDCSLTLNESEVKRLQKALGKFIEVRERLRSEFEL